MDGKKLLSTLHSTSSSLMKALQIMKKEFFIDKNKPLKPSLPM